MSAVKGYVPSSDLFFLLITVLGGSDARTVESIDTAEASSNGRLFDNDTGRLFLSDAHTNDSRSY